MNLELKEWLHLLLRWGHVFAGILWVGTTYYFTWLDGRFAALERQFNQSPTAQNPPEKQVWMVHSGGFYVVEKLKVPNVMPEKLHWFRWEAALTWLTGILLFALVYYHGGLLVSLEDARISPAAAIWLSIGLLVATVPVYDLLWFRLLKNERLGVVVSLLLITTLAWFLARAKASSKHNTFLVVPVVFMMISNHFPSITYGRSDSWLILSGLVLLGWVGAKLLRRA